MTLSILGRAIRVITISNGDLDKISGTENSLGLYMDDTIYLASSLQDEARRRVLLHEATHAVLTISGLTNLIEDNLEEAICDAVEALANVTNF